MPHARSWPACSSPDPGLYVIAVSFGAAHAARRQQWFMLTPNIGLPSSLDRREDRALVGGLPGGHRWGTTEWAEAARLGCWAASSSVEPVAAPAGQTTLYKESSTHRRRPQHQRRRVNIPAPRRRPSRAPCGCSPRSTVEFNPQRRAGVAHLHPYPSRCRRPRSWPRSAPTSDAVAELADGITQMLQPPPPPPPVVTRAATAEMLGLQHVPARAGARIRYALELRALRHDAARRTRANWLNSLPGMTAGGLVTFVVL